MEGKMEYGFMEKPAFPSGTAGGNKGYFFEGQIIIDLAHYSLNTVTHLPTEDTRLLVLLLTDLAVRAGAAAAAGGGGLRGDCPQLHPRPGAANGGVLLLVILLPGPHVQVLGDHRHHQLQRRAHLHSAEWREMFLL